MPDDLNQRRIKHAAYERRVLLRARFIMGLTAIFCIVGSSMLVQSFMQGLQNHGQKIFLAIDVVAAVVLFISALGLLRTALMVHRRLKKARLSESGNSPDFTPLSDGSQRAKKFDDLK